MDGIEPEENSGEWVWIDPVIEHHPPPTHSMAMTDYTPEGHEKRIIELEEKVKQLELVIDYILRRISKEHGMDDQAV